MKLKPVRVKHSNIIISTTSVFRNKYYQVFQIYAINYLYISVSLETKKILHNIISLNGFKLNYLSIVKAVMVRTVALVKLSAANLCILQTVSPNGYSWNHNIYTSSGKALKMI